MHSFAHHNQAFNAAVQTDVTTQQARAHHHVEAALDGPCRLSQGRRCSARSRSLISLRQLCYSMAWVLRAIRKPHISTAATPACQLKVAGCSGALAAYLCSNSSGMLFFRHLSMTVIPQQLLSTSVHFACGLLMLEQLLYPLLSIAVTLHHIIQRCCSLALSNGVIHQQ